MENPELNIAQEETSSMNKTFTFLKSKIGFFFFIIPFIAVGAGVFLVYRIMRSEQMLIPLSFLPLILGLIFEYKRISKQWLTVAKTTAFAYIISFVAFLPVKSESTYVLDNHIAFWPYVFCIVLILIAIAFFEKKLIPKLHEGITMVQSLTLIYWILDNGFLNSNIFVKTLVVIGLLFTAFSLLHAFTYLKLSWNQRFFLSLWSSLIMIVFSIDNIWGVYHYCRLDLTDNWNIFLVNFLQYFMMGVSGIYIVLNISMVMVFIPTKGRFFNDQYFKDVLETKLKHTERYSQSQVKILFAFLGCIAVASIYWLNYKYQIIPRNLAIWTVFVFYPMVVWGLKKLVTNQSPVLLI